MVSLTFIEPDGSEKNIEAQIGDSIMVAATTAGVEGIDAECGGSCMCATCHCLIVGGPASALPEPDEQESDTLEFTAESMEANSRLTCQIEVSEALDGLKLQVVGH